MIYSPPIYPTDVPSEADFTIIFDDLDMYWAKYHNQYNKEIRAIMNELGTLPKGSFATVKARLEAALDNTSSITDLATKDHHLLNGLSDDDHTQYYNAARHTLALHTGMGLIETCDKHTKALHTAIGLLETCNKHTKTLHDALALDHGALSGKDDDDHSQYYNATRHTKTLHDNLGLDHGSLSGKGDDDHSQYYNDTRHTKALHDTLGLDHGALSGKGDDDHSQYLNNSRHNALNHDPLNIDADKVDGYHAGNESNQVPISNASVCTGLNAMYFYDHFPWKQAVTLAPNTNTGWLATETGTLYYPTVWWRNTAGTTFSSDCREVGVKFEWNYIDNTYRISNGSGNSRRIYVSCLRT